MHNNIVLFTGNIFTSVYFPISKPHLVADPGFDLRGRGHCQRLSCSSLQWQMCVQHLRVRMAVCVRVRTEVTLAPA